MLLLKVCGATSRDDVDLLHRTGTDLAGLWFGVPGGANDLPLDRLASLAGACRRRGHLQPMLVTFLRDPDVLVAAARYAGIDWLQLHGYQLPGVVAEMKRTMPQLTVVKVLHIHRDECVEWPLLASYERAGVDLFLLDATSDDGQVGSTGQALDPHVVLEVAEKITVPFLLAGGISASTRSRYDEVVHHPRFAGIDVDTGARDAAGSLQHDNVEAIRRSWPSVTTEGVR